MGFLLWHRKRMPTTRPQPDRSSPAPSAPHSNSSSASGKASGLHAVAGLAAAAPSRSTPSAQRRWRLRQAEALAVVVFVLGLAATFTVWRAAERQVERNRQTEFDFQARRTVRAIEQRMSTYQQVERDTQAFLLGNMDVRREDFRLFVAAIGLQEHFPGIQGLALARLVSPGQREQHVAALRADSNTAYAIVPAGSRPVYSAITNIEPYSGLNLRALGFDMLTDPVRRAAMEQARDTGAAAASGKLRLIQEDGRDVQSGFVMYIPVYRRGAATATLAERRASLVGLVGARSSDLTLAIYDGTRIDPAAQLYSTAKDARLPAGFKPALNSVRQIVVAGAPWTVAIGSTPQLEARITASSPHWIALGGAIASGLLALLVLALGSGKRRALNLATAMTE